jgi:hypothetical protein
MKTMNRMCMLSDLNQEQIDNLFDAAADEGFNGFIGDELYVGFSNTGCWGSWKGSHSPTIISYTEMMQLLGKTMKEFTKSDLKTGMFVKYREGSYRIVIGGILSGDGHGVLSDFSNDLRCDGAHESALDIIAVYKASQRGTINKYLKGEHLTLIWERTEQTPAQKEMEVLQVKMNESQAKMNELQAQMKVVQAKL